MDTDEFDNMTNAQQADYLIKRVSRKISEVRTGEFWTKDYDEGEMEMMLTALWEGYERTGDDKGVVVGFS